jgi:lysozyme
MRKINQAGLDLIKSFEDFVDHVYLDAVGIPTIGYGHVVHKNESFTIIDETKAEQLLQQDSSEAIKSVLRLIKVPLTDNQFGALVSFTFNLGGGTLQHSTLRMKINRQDFDVENEFLKYRKAGGKILKGLIRRRQTEANLFNS